MGRGQSDDNVSKAETKQKSPSPVSDEGPEPEFCCRGYGTTGYL